MQVTDYLKKEILDLLYDISNVEKIGKLINFGSSSGQDIIYGIYDYLSAKVASLNFKL